MIGNVEVEEIVFGIDPEYKHSTQFQCRVTTREECAGGLRGGMFSIRGDRRQVLRALLAYLNERNASEGRKQ